MSGTRDGYDSCTTVSQMKQITFSMNKLDPKSQDTSEALGARGAGGSHTQKTECVSTAAHRYRCSRFLLVPASLFACPLPFLSRNRRSLRQFVRKARLSTNTKFDGVTSCTTSIRPSVAFSDRGGGKVKQSRDVLHSTVIVIRTFINRGG